MATSVPPGMAMPSAGIGGARTAAEQMADRRHAEVLLEDAVHASLPEDIDNPDPWAGGNDPWSRPFEAENPVMGTGGLASEDSRVPHSYSPPGFLVMAMVFPLLAWMVLEIRALEIMVAFRPRFIMEYLKGGLIKFHRILVYSLAVLLVYTHIWCLEYFLTCFLAHLIRCLGRMVTWHMDSHKVIPGPLEVVPLFHLMVPVSLQMGLPAHHRSRGLSRQPRSPPRVLLQCDLSLRRLCLLHRVHLLFQILPMEKILMKATHRALQLEHPRCDQCWRGELKRRLRWGPSHP